MKQRILVVDDQRDVADALVRLLTRLGYESRAVYEGASAEAVALDFLPNLAFIDISMPGFDGFQTVSKVRANRECIHIVFVALTGNSTPEIKQRAYDSGFDLFVAKPMGVETLKEVITVIDPGATTLAARDLAHRLSEVWGCGNVASDRDLRLAK
jgi:CheY-like chemotaxis protein